MLRIRDNLTIQYRGIFSNNIIETTILLGKEETDQKISYFIFWFSIIIEKSSQHKKSRNKYEKYATA